MLLQQGHAHRWPGSGLLGWRPPKLLIHPQAESSAACRGSRRALWTRVALAKSPGLGRRALLCVPSWFFLSVGQYRFKVSSVHFGKECRLLYAACAGLLHGVVNTVKCSDLLILYKAISGVLMLHRTRQRYLGQVGTLFLLIPVWQGPWPFLSYGKQLCVLLGQPLVKIINFVVAVQLLSCLTLCNPIGCHTLQAPQSSYLLGFAQVHVH